MQHYRYKAEYWHAFYWEFIYFLLLVTLRSIVFFFFWQIEDWSMNLMFSYYIVGRLLYVYFLSCCYEPISKIYLIFFHEILIFSKIMTPNNYWISVYYYAIYNTDFHSFSICQYFYYVYRLNKNKMVIYFIFSRS